MDIEQIVRNVGDLMKFKAEVEAMMAKAHEAGVPEVSVDDIRKITAFIPEIEEAIGHARAVINDIAALAGDVELIRKDLAPIIEWVQAKQKAEADAAEKADAEARELAEQQSAEAAKVAEKPLAHLAEAEQKIASEGEPTAV